MDAASTLHAARRRAGLSLRELAARAGTSHGTLAAYEAGRKDPGVATLARILRAAGYEVQGTLRPAIGGVDPVARGRELEAVLALAAEFPARHADRLSAPVFGRVPSPC